MIVNMGVDVFTKTRTKRKTLRKTQTNINTENISQVGADFYIQLAGGRFAPLPRCQLRHW